MPKKNLIEVALPLDAINEQTAREKSIRHGMINAIWPERGFARTGSYHESTGDFSDLRLPFEDRTAGVADDSSLLVVRAMAVKQRERKREREREAEPSDDPLRPSSSLSPNSGVNAPGPPRPRRIVADARFGGAVGLKPCQDLAVQLHQLAEEVLVYLQSADPDTLEIRVSLSADRSAGFNQDTVCTVSENARSLGIVPSRFADL